MPALRIVEIPKPFKHRDHIHAESIGSLFAVKE